MKHNNEADEQANNLIALRGPYWINPGLKSTAPEVNEACEFLKTIRFGKLRILEMD